MPQGDAVRAVKDRLDVVEVISQYVRLQKAGTEYKGLCPFHSEKSPSFTVNQEKQVYYCFGCQAGGDLFDFIQRVEGTDFVQTLQTLAERAGVELEERRPGAQRRKRERQVALEANRLAAQFFQHILLNHAAGGRGLRYLEKRGVEPETVEAFGVGYAPAGRNGDNLLRFLKKKGISEADAALAGLGYAGNDGRRPMDRFRGRLMIPIRDEAGEVIAFGGRAMDSSPNKYMNSPQTPLYDKSRTIFGLSHARKAIAEAGKALLVEGYFDVMMAHQNGITTAVASSGTAITDEQLRLLKRFTTDLVLCLDGDEAGRHATQRAIEMSARSGMRAVVVELPNAKDPGDFFHKTPQLWQEAEGAALAGWEWWLSSVLREHKLSSAEGRVAAAAAVVPVLSKIPEESTLDIYCQVAAERLKIDPAVLLTDVRSFRKSGKLSEDLRPLRRPAAWGTVGSAPPAPAGEAPASPPDGSPEEDRLLALLMTARGAGEALVEVRGDEPCGTAAFEDLCRRVLELVAEEGSGTLGRHLERFPPEERPRMARLSLAEGFEGEDLQLRAAIADCIDRIRLKKYEADMTVLEEKLRATGVGEDSGQRDGLLTEHRHLAQRRAALRLQLFQGRV